MVLKMLILILILMCGALLQAATIRPQAATIFYYTDRGTPQARPIYGVHPDSNINVPSNVAAMTVPEPSHQISWPIPAGYTAGKEQWTVVDTTTSPPTLRVQASLVPALQSDRAAFLKDLRVNFTRLRLKQIFDVGMLAALENENYAQLKADLNEDLASLLITQAEYDAIIGAGVKRNFPGW